MDISRFDGQYVRITLKDGDVFDGECFFYGAEYCLAEFGREEDALSIDNRVFYSDDILQVGPVPAADGYIWQGCRVHRMRLAPSAFSKIESGLKTIELRLYDEKRRRVKKGDVIRFACTDDDGEVLFVIVHDIYVFPSFDELYRSLPLDECGYAPEEVCSASPRDMDVYYTSEEQEKYGVVGIRISLL